MGVNAKNSLADPICPTYAAGTLSITSSGSKALNNDSAGPAGNPNGYVNQINDATVGSYNNNWTNGYHTQSKNPTYSTGLLSFGRTGSQS